MMVKVVERKKNKENASIASSINKLRSKKKKRSVVRVLCTMGILFVGREKRTHIERKKSRNMSTKTILLSYP